MWHNTKCSWSWCFLLTHESTTSRNDGLSKEEYVTKAMETKKVISLVHSIISIIRSRSFISSVFQGIAFFIHCKFGSRAYYISYQILVLVVLITMGTNCTRKYGIGCHKSSFIVIEYSFLAMQKWLFWQMLAMSTYLWYPNWYW